VPDGRAGQGQGAPKPSLLGSDSSRNAGTKLVGTGFGLDRRQDDRRWLPPCPPGFGGRGPPEDVSTVRVSEVVEAISADLAALGELGDEATAGAARRLAAAMQAPLMARLLDFLGQVAGELGAALPDQQVEVRLVGGDVQLAVQAAPSEPLAEEDADGAGGAGAGEDAGARITLRLPSRLKARVEEASAREGLSVNSYIVRALSQAVRAERGLRGLRVGRRLSGYGRS
jgi:hypothetical protein